MGMPTRRTAGVAVALLLVLTAAACSDATEDPGVATLGEGSTRTEGSGDAQDATTEEQLLAWARCMREEGVDVPDPQVGEDGRVEIGPGAGGGVDPGDPDVQEAMEACRDEMPNGGEPPELDPEQEAAMQDAQLAFAECMNGEGIEVLEPTGDGSGFLLGPDSGIDPNDPDVRAALEVCMPILEEVLPGGPGGGDA
jgi:hypothetical protein